MVIMMKFTIPNKFEDLTAVTTENGYIVSQKYPLREVNDFIQNLPDKLREKGPTFVFEDFDHIYSAIDIFKTLDTQKRTTLYQILVRSLAELESDLVRELQKSRNSWLSDTSKKLLQCNTLKMIVFSLCTLSETIEGLALANKWSSSDPKTPAKKKAPSESSFSAYERERDKFISILYKLLVLPLQLIFQPPVVEEDLIRCINSCCWRLIEHQSLHRNKALIDDIFNIIGFSIVKYSGSLGFCLKIIQLIRNRENLVPIVAQLVSSIVVNHQQSLLISEIIREIERINIKDLTVDSSGPRAISTFLCEVAEKCPKEMMSSVINLLPFLEQDSYMMRNATLSIIGSVVSHNLSHDKMTCKEKDLRDELLSKLELHLLDVSSYTRGRALQVLSKLCQERKIPLARIDSLLESVIDRLKDKTTYVRKYAVQFLTFFLRSNIFGVELNIKTLEAGHSKAKENLDAMIAVSENLEREDDGPASGDETLKDDAENSILNDTIIKDDNDPKNPDPDGPDPKSDNEGSGGEEGEESREKCLSEIEKQRKLVRYFEDIIKVTNYIKSSVPLVCTLLYSKNIQDVQEAITFLVTAYEFGIKEEAEVGLRRMIVLIFSSDGTKKEVVEAYKKILFDAPDSANKTGLDKAKLIVKKLIDLVKGSNLDEIISLQELLQDSSFSSEFDKHVIQLMWDKFALRSSSATEEESQICVQLISMLAESNPQLIRKNLDILVSVGLGDRALSDLKLARFTCCALSKAMTNQGRIVTTELPYRLLRNHPVFESISNVVVETFVHTELEGWLPLCEEAFRAIFNLAEHPDMVAEDILYEMIRKIMEISRLRANSPTYSSEYSCSTDEKKAYSASQSSNQTSVLSSTMSSKTISDPIVIPPQILARFIHCVGTIAMNTLVHLEVNIFTEMKTRNAIKEERDNRKSTMNTRISMSKRKSGRRSTGLPNEEDELGLTGVVSAEDAEAEFIYSLCNSEIVDPKKRDENLLARLARMVINVATDPEKYSHSHLKAAASLSLAKLMAISENFCQNNLRLLVTILKKAEDPIIRSNTIIAVGDLCVRFPNLLEPWTSHLYQSLRDDCTLVRTNALKVISRLILSDMIKVQDQISEIAKLMVDEEEKVSSFARLFFTQLSKKLNAIYNVLPDIISNLSDSEVGIDQSNFQFIMSFLFELIDKEAHRIGLLEKICQRYKNTLDERQWVDLAYCLSLIKYSDKSIGKLFENFSCYGNKVSVQSVFDLFMVIINNTRKATGLKNETKQILDEFESKLRQTKNKGLDEAEIEKDNVDGDPESEQNEQIVETVETVQNGHKESAVNGHKRNGNRNKASKARKESEDESSEDEEQDEDNYDEEDAEVFDETAQPIQSESISRSQRRRVRRH